MRCRSRAGTEQTSYGYDRSLWSSASILFLLAATGLCHAHAQVSPTASQALSLSAFGAVTGDYTGLEGGKNLSVTAGADLDFRARQFFSMQPAVELRATYPMDSGHISAQKNILGGFRGSWLYGPIRPYADVLVGDGRLNYHGGIPNPAGTYLYFHSSSLVLSAGGGAELRFSNRLAVKGDIQLQHYSTPVSASGSIYARPLTLGIVYRFDLNHAAGHRVF